jgi:hypothetical protein
MITDDGRAALIDFDLAGVLRECHSFGSFAISTDALTCRWTSPEMLLLSEELEGDDSETMSLLMAADVWAFACVCYKVCVISSLLNPFYPLVFFKGEYNY